MIEQRLIGAYSERARGAVFWSTDDRHAPSPLELVRRAVKEFPNEFVGALRRLRELQVEDLRTCVARVPVSWISSLAKKFALQLMCYNLAELRKLL